MKLEEFKSPINSPIKRKKTYVAKPKTPLVAPLTASTELLNT